ncbi:MAG TPA: DUF664 domain-containing protein [Mycobacterium sp.]
MPSKTTLLGLVKHVTYVEGVWFDQALTGRSYADIGIATTSDRSLTLRKADTVASVSAVYRARAEASRHVARHFTSLSSSTAEASVRMSVVSAGAA